MPAKRQEQILGTVVCSFAVIAVTLSIIAFAINASPNMAAIVARTENVSANVTKAERGGYNYIIEYNYAYGDQTYSGDANCSDCDVAYNAAKRTGVIEVWVNPQDPFSSSLKGPNWIGFIFVWGLIAFLLLVVVGCYIGAMAKIWDWNLFNNKKVATPQKELLVLIQHTDQSILEQVYEDLVERRLRLIDELDLSDMSVLRGDIDFCLSELKKGHTPYPVIVITDKETYVTTGARIMGAGATIVYKFVGTSPENLGIFFTKCIRHFYLNESLE